MTSITLAEQIATSLPEVTERISYGNRGWAVGKKGFAWVRPLTKADIKRLGGVEPPAGELLAVATEDLHEREALLTEHPDCCFTIEHFKNYPALLVILEQTTEEVLRDLITNAWLAVAPAKLAASFAEGLDR